MMHNWTQKMMLFMGTCFILFSVAYGQGSFHYGGGHFNPDSLILVTISGTALVDTFTFHNMYFLDEDGNGTEDYILNFGPPWYQPDSSGATRPNDGDPVTISGGMHDSTGIGLPFIVVYEINGEFWRDPYDPLWTNLGMHSHTGGHHHGGITGFAFGWMHDTLNVDTLNGTVLVDTTLTLEHYYLDVDGNNQPDYFLNFGPPWYQPSSGATRSQYGETVEIIGGVMSNPNLPVVIVYQINGLLWRDSTGFGNHFGGGWIYQNMTSPRWVHSAFDTLNGMHMSPGWHMGGGMMPDTLFCQILELYPQNMPNTGSLKVFAGNEIGIFFPNGMNGMWQGGGGGQMNFATNVQFQLHYNDIQLQGRNIDESTIEARFWDKNSNSWLVVSGAVLDPINNTVTFQQNSISTYVILTGQEYATAINEKQKLIADGFLLKQNYPNPFNPMTNIDFILDKPARVELIIFNVLGQQVIRLMNKQMDIGVYSVPFDGQQLPSGIYFYQLKSGNTSQVRKMELMK